MGTYRGCVHQGKSDVFLDDPMAHCSESTVTNQTPNVSESTLQPFDYIICVTKNCPDIEPAILTLIGPAVVPDSTIIVLIQSGLNIEKPFFEAFMQNIVLSGVSMIDSHEAEAGHIIHEWPDLLYLGPFRNQNIDVEGEQAVAEVIITMYAARGRTKCLYCH